MKKTTIAMIALVAILLGCIRFYYTAFRGMENVKLLSVMTANEFFQCLNKQEASHCAERYLPPREMYPYEMSAIVNAAATFKSTLGERTFGKIVADSWNFKQNFNWFSEDEIKMSFTLKAHYSQATAAIEKVTVYRIDGKFHVMEFAIWPK